MLGLRRELVLAVSEKAKLGCVGSHSDRGQCWCWYRVRVEGKLGVNCFC